jgi:hypothetical protein
MESSLAKFTRSTRGNTMSETVKKKRSRPSVTGGADNHPVSLHDHGKSDLDRMIAAIEHLPRRIVREQLREFGIDPDRAVKRLEGTIDSFRRDHHLPQTLTDASRTGGRGAVVATPSHFVLGWSGTQFIADGLRHAPTPDAGLAVIAEGFKHLGAAADALRSHCADPDAVWPMAEAIYEATIIAAVRPELWKAFAGAHAQLAMRLSYVHQCVLVHNLQELREGHVASPRFLAMLCDGLSGSKLSREARVLLAPSSGHKRIPWRESPRRGNTIALLRNPVTDPLASFWTMYWLGEAAETDPAATHGVAELMHSLHDDAASHYFTMGVLTRVHKRDPNRAASTMAGAAKSATETARYALFVSTIKGYEHSFAGRRQEVVPQFDLAGAPRFVPGKPHDLDVFGEMICRSDAARELHPQMEWANRRLAIWLSR